MVRKFYDEGPEFVAADEVAKEWRETWGNDVLEVVSEACAEVGYQQAGKSDDPAVKAWARQYRDALIAGNHKLVGEMVCVAVDRYLCRIAKKRFYGI